MKKLTFWIVLLVLFVVSIADAQVAFTWRRLRRLPEEIRTLPETVAEIEQRLSLVEQRLDTVEAKQTEFEGRIAALESGGGITDTDALIVVGGMLGALAGAQASTYIHADIMSMVNNNQVGLYYLSSSGERIQWTDELLSEWQTRADDIENGAQTVWDISMDFRTKFDELSVENKQLLLEKATTLIQQASNRLDLILLPGE